MLGTDRYALMCDLAETYHVYDYRALPVCTLAALACGLREDSRIMMKMAGLNNVPDNFMLAKMADDIAVLRYILAKGTKPVLVSDMISGKADTKKGQKVDTYASHEEFLKEMGLL